MREWLEQGDVVILSHGNMKIGFHATGKADLDALITFFYADRGGVDAMHARFASVADAPPRLNEKYRIYHFFARDPEGRRIEFQSFEHDLEPFLDGGELLATRRSVRQFRIEQVDDRIVARDARKLSPCAVGAELAAGRVLVVRDRPRAGAAGGLAARIVRSDRARADGGRDRERSGDLASCRSTTDASPPTT